MKLVALLIGALLVAAACSNDDASTAEAEALAPTVAAVEQIVRVDNGFGGQDAFDTVLVGSTVEPIESADASAIADRLADVAEVEVVADPDAEIERLAEGGPTAAGAQGVAVVVVDGVRSEGDGAEVDLRLWCGSLCGVFLTYELAMDDGGWTVLGTTGPIAMS